MWPGPSVGPHPATGSSATSSGLGRLGHLLEQLGVSREVDRAPATDEEAQRLSTRAAGAAAVVARLAQR